MIEPKEINKIATINKVRDQQIEKDYVLTWVLYAISKNEVLREAMVFKGGTVLKKAYIEDYRFSEDLDFTLLNEDITNEQIRDEFNRLFAFIAEEANIPVYDAVITTPRKGMGKALKACRMIQDKKQSADVSGIVTFIDPITHKQLKQVSIATSDAEMTKTINKLLN